MTHNPHAIAALRQSLTADALLVTSPLNVSYLTGFGGDSSFLAVSVADATIISDERFRIDLRDDCPGFAAKIRGPHRDTWQEAADLIRANGWKRVAVEASALSVAQFDRLQTLVPGVEWLKTSGLVEGLRAIKTAEEVEATRSAVRIAEAAFVALMATLRPDDTERGVADRLEALMRDGGADGPAFPTIVGFGARSALPHARPSATGRLEDSQFLLVDWGAEAGGYRSDQTRVILSPFRERGGPVELRLRALYTVVSEARSAAEKAVRPGVEVREADAAARGVIDAAGMGDRFNHGLGHGLGREVHESPSIRRNSDDLFAAGQIVTLEPGVYFEGFGGVRLEDPFLVTGSGCERMGALGLGLELADGH